jgi:hypothetical protein
VRYARRIGRPVVLVYPDGTVDPGARPAFLVSDYAPARPVSVFLARDPRNDGYRFPVEAVLLETLPASNRAGGSGTATARPGLGRSTSDPQRYREFASRKAMGRAGFTPVGPYRVCDSWDDYRYPWHLPGEQGQIDTLAPLPRLETKPEIDLTREREAAGLVSEPVVASN